MPPSSLNIFNIESEADFVDLLKGRSASYRVRELVYRASQAENNISLVFKDTLKAIKKLFSEFKIIDSEGRSIEVKCIFANPERPVAKMVQEDNMILPIISVSQPKTDAKNDRQKYLPLIVTETLWDDKKQRAIRLISLAPKPVDINYKVAVWSKYKSDLDQITEQIYLKFNPSHELLTSYASNIKAIITDESNDSAVDVGDREDRIVMRSFNIVVETYIPTPKFIFSATGKIEKYYNDITIVKEIK